MRGKKAETKDECTRSIRCFSKERKRRKNVITMRADDLKGIRNRDCFIEQNTRGFYYVEHYLTSWFPSTLIHRTGSLLDFYIRVTCKIRVVLYSQILNVIIAEQPIGNDSLTSSTCERLSSDEISISFLSNCKQKKKKRKKEKKKKG